MSPRTATRFAFVSSGALYLAFWLAGNFGSPALSQPLNESLLKAALWIVPSLVIVTLAWRLSEADAVRELGLLANPLVGCAFALVTAIPIAALWMQDRLTTPTMAAIAGTALIGPFAEEVLFRGLLFRQLVRRGCRRPVWAMAVTALIFGLAHITGFIDYSHGHWAWVQPWSMSFVELGVTAFGGLLFAWITYRWDSLWPAIGLHASLNFSWLLTNGAEDVTNFAAAMTRLASVTIACYVTWRATRATARRTGLTRLSSPIGER